MHEDSQVEIKLLGEGDIPAAMKLKEFARWNQTESDWRRLLKLEPDGCFAAWLDGRVVGTTTTTTYGSELAWIGMVLVDPRYRRRGIASRLMRKALDYLREAGIATVKLDATPEGRTVYEAFGFESELLIERWMGVPLPASVTDCRALDEVARPSVLAFDRQAFGADRAGLLNSLIAEACVEPLIATTTDGHLRGYALARSGTSAVYIGPLISADERSAAVLLDGILGQLTDQRVYIDLHTGSGKSKVQSPRSEVQIYIDLHTGFEGGKRLLSERGFAKQRDLIRMSYGEPNSAGTSELVFAIAGPEIG